ncbi:conserved hypothetical protein [Vibrio chagasii]|nr:conserved hypothetical protein [Vibrio chagasii]
MQGDRFYLSNAQNLPLDLSGVKVQHLTILKHSCYKVGWNRERTN